MQILCQDVYVKNHDSIQDSVLVVVLLMMTSLQQQTEDIVTVLWYISLSLEEIGI